MKFTQGSRAVILSKLLPHSYEEWFAMRIQPDDRPSNSDDGFEAHSGESHPSGEW